MGEYNRLSIRTKRQMRGDAPIIVRYDHAPDQLRTQALHVISKIIGPVPDSIYANRPYPLSLRILNAIRGEALEEFGLFWLMEYRQSAFDEISDFMHSCDSETFFDFVEIAFRSIESFEVELAANFANRSNVQSRYELSEGIERLNRRLAEHDLGYRYVPGTPDVPGFIVRADSEFLHSEAVLPALLALHDVQFDGPMEEFTQALKHYRKGDYPSSVSEASKAFESTLKAICTDQGWEFNENATAAPLVNVVVENGLIPSYLETQLSALRTLLTNTVPPVGNRNGRHGQGKARANVPDHVAAYALHLTGSNILFLIQCHHALIGETEEELPEFDLDDVPF